MKNKKLLSLAMLVCGSLTITGCGGSIKALDRQLTKIVEQDEKNEIYGDDYRVSATKKIGSLETTDLVFKKDNDKIYLYTNDSNFWIGKKNDKNYVFFSDGNTKQYTEITEGKAKSLFEMLEEKVQGFIGKQSEIVKNVKGYIQLCDEENISCEFGNNLFGSEASFEIERKDGRDPQEFEIEIKKGKITELYRKTTSIQSTITFSATLDYGNQEVKIPSNDGYESNAAVLSYLSAVNF